MIKKILSAVAPKQTSFGFIFANWINDFIVLLNKNDMIIFILGHNDLKSFFNVVIVVLEI